MARITRVAYVACMARVALVACVVRLISFVWLVCGLSNFFCTLDHVWKLLTCNALPVHLLRQEFVLQGASGLQNGLPCLPAPLAQRILAIL